MSSRVYPMRPLILMVKPPVAQANTITALPHANRARGANLLHMTILGLWDAAAEKPVSVKRLSTMLDTFRMPPFDVVFDHVQRSGKRVELVSSRPLAEARTLRQLLVDHLIDRCDVPVRRPRKLRPHVTLHYNSPGYRFKERIVPIAWRVEEFLLIESVIGQTHHNTLGRWPLLKGDARSLEFTLPLFQSALGSRLP